MVDLSFVESEFQLSVASVVTPNADVIFVRRRLISRLIDSLVATSQLLLALFRKKRIVIYDHRNPLVLVAIMVCKVSPSRFEYVFVGDDGFHSLIVDKFQQKFLYWRSNYVKAYLLKKFQDELLSFKRLHCLKDMRSYSPRGSIFIDYYGGLADDGNSCCGSVIFIDQPAIVESMPSHEFAGFAKMLKIYTNLEIILHPRRRDLGIYTDLGFSCRSSDNINLELRAASQPVKVIGFFSTVLLAAKRLGHEIQILKIPSSIDEFAQQYACAAIEIINEA